jgi:hypothetical protein
MLLLLFVAVSLHESASVGRRRRHRLPRRFLSRSDSSDVVSSVSDESRYHFGPSMLIIV